MKVLVVSDTHGSNEFIIEEINRIKDLDLVIHLGDYVSDALEIKEEIKLPIKMVRGNNDYLDRKVDYDRVIYLENHKVFLTHGHKYGVYFGPEGLYQKAIELGCDIVFYGHTHVYADEEIGGIRIINPGSPSLPRDRHKSYALVDIKEDLVEVHRCIIK